MLDLFWYLHAHGKETYQTASCVLILPYFYERTLFYREQLYKHTYALKYLVTRPGWGRGHWSRWRREWQKCRSLIAVPFGVRRRGLRGLLPLKNRISFSFFTSQKSVLDSVDTFYWRAAQSFKVHSEKNGWVHGKKNGLAVASDYWFAHTFLYNTAFVHAVRFVRGRSLATDIHLTYE